MATGNEHVLAIDPNILVRYAKPGWEKEVEEEWGEVHPAYLANTQLINSLNDELRRVQKELLLAEFGNCVPSPRGYTSVVTTPEGLREFSPWCISTYGDEDTETKDCIVGLSVAGRYFPNWLDWRDAHGGGWNPRLALQPDYVRLLDAARAALRPVCVELAEAPLLVVSNFY